MKKILILSDGIVGKSFVQRVVNTYTSDNIYYVVQNKKITYENANPKKFKFYNFDPTSFYKLDNILKMEFIQVIIIMDSPPDIENSIKNIRIVKKDLRIVVLNQFNMNLDAYNVVNVNANEFLSARMLDFLPNVPVIAQNVGTADGEIMEVLVPFGSSFVYRHIGVIEQNGWRIVAIYRNRKLILPESDKMIHPNDLLLLVGEPMVLQSIYRSIKRVLGQFPEPYGTNLYIPIDMDIESRDDIVDIMQRALYIHTVLAHDIVIKIINPSDIETVEYIKAFSTTKVHISIDYTTQDRESVILNDIKKYHVGIVLVSRNSFKEHSFRSTLYFGKVPVLKLGKKEQEFVKDVIVVLNSNALALEKISTTVYDISAQLGFNLEIISYKSDNCDKKDEIINHFKNLSNIFSKSIKINEMSRNPIKELQKRDNFLQCLPFSEEMIQRHIFSILSTDSEKLYHKLDDYPQLFIPTGA
ncbi:MAG: TrkA C-terminal domain-containing protein [Campylobacterota bacterium]|nr:TrkA C-terminal domain-containing protein [Campylobacterota bacterium]